MFLRSVFSLSLQHSLKRYLINVIFYVLERTLYENQGEKANTIKIIRLLASRRWIRKNKAGISFSPLCGTEYLKTYNCSPLFFIIHREFYSICTLIIKLDTDWSWVLFLGLTDFPELLTKTFLKTKKEVIQHKTLPKQERQSESHYSGNFPWADCKSTNGSDAEFEAFVPPHCSEVISLMLNTGVCLPCPSISIPLNHKNSIS